MDGWVNGWMDRGVNLKGTVMDNEDNEEGDNWWMKGCVDGWMDGFM